MTNDETLAILNCMTLYVVPANVQIIVCDCSHLCNLKCLKNQIIKITTRKWIFQAVDVPVIGKWARVTFPKAITEELVYYNGFLVDHRLVTELVIK